MHMITDARGNAFPSSFYPSRIVSLVPSTTETLYKLGINDRIVGVTRYCVHPKEARQEKSIVGGTKQLNWEAVKNCRPDLVIGNQEENSKQIFQDLQAMNIPYYIAFPKTIDDALDDLENLGKLLNASTRAREIGTMIKSARRSCNKTKFRFAYLIWRRPYMTLNDQTFISEMLQEIGGVNVFQGHPERYITCQPAEILAHSPDVVLLSSEPYPFKEKHIPELLQAGFARQQIKFIDGEMCSWHGVRLVEAFDYLNKVKASWF